MDEALYVAIAAVLIAFIGTLVVPVINHQLEIKRQYRREKMELYKQIVHFFNISRVYYQFMTQFIPENAPKDSGFFKVGRDDDNPEVARFKSTASEWDKEREKAERVTPNFIFLENDNIRNRIYKFRNETYGALEEKTVGEAFYIIDELGLLLEDIIPIMQKDLGLKPRPKRSKEEIITWA